MSSPISAYINTLWFGCGVEVSIDKDTILVVVGPNNSGKSTTLSDIRGILSDSNYGPIAITNISVKRISTSKSIEEYFQPVRRIDGSYMIGGSYLPYHSIDNLWNSDKPFIGLLAKYTVSELTTKVRLSDADPAQSFQATIPFSADHPFQHMYRDDKLEQKISEQFRQAFREDLLIHRVAGNTIPAYVGPRPILLDGEDRLSRTYLDRVERLQRLETQGDGMKAFVSVIGRVQTEARPIQLIDEPEAFLHPPQARIVAEIIASEGKGQIFLATHSVEVLQGVLHHHSSRVSVVRMTRTRCGNSVNFLEKGSVEVLWKDPILRFSGVLDGLFHEGVIVTEADADCRFYEAIMNSAVSREDQSDIHYTYSGGKDRVPILVAALAGLGVPVATILDFDALSAEQPIRRIVESYGADWGSFESDWVAVKAAVEGKSAFVGGREFVAELRNIAKGCDQNTSVPRETLSRVKKLARNASPWERTKDSGLAAIPSGDATCAAEALLKNLCAVGIFIVPKGEMEGFCRSVGGHGPRWVEEVLRRDLASDKELEEARKFTREVNCFLKDTQERLAVATPGSLTCHTSD